MKRLYLSLLLLPLTLQPARTAWAGLDKDARRELSELEEVLPVLLDQAAQDTSWCAQPDQAQAARDAVARGRELVRTAAGLALRPKEAARVMGDQGLGQLCEALAWEQGLCEVREAAKKDREAAKDAILEAELRAGLAPVRAVELLVMAQELWTRGGGADRPPGLDATCDLVGEHLLPVPAVPWVGGDGEAPAAELAVRADALPAYMTVCAAPYEAVVRLVDSSRALGLLTQADAERLADPMQAEMDLRAALGAWPVASVWTKDDARALLGACVAASDSQLVEAVTFLETTADLAEPEPTKALRRLRVALDRLAGARPPTEEEALGALRARVDALEKRRTAEVDALEKQRTAEIERREKEERQQRAALDALLGEPQVVVTGRWFWGSPESGEIVGPDEVPEILAPIATSLRNVGLRNVVVSISGAPTRADVLSYPQAVQVEAELTSCAVATAFKYGAYPTERDRVYGQLFDETFVRVFIDPARWGIISSSNHVALYNHAGKVLEITLIGDRIFATLDGVSLNRDGTIMMPVEYVEPVRAFLADVRACP